MPQPQDDQTKLQTTDDTYQQTAANVADQLKTIYGEDHQTVPAHQKAADESLGEELDRVIFAKPGYEPSKKFLDKLFERVKKKNPDAEVKLKE